MWWIIIICGLLLIAFIALRKSNNQQKQNEDELLRYCSSIVLLLSESNSSYKVIKSKSDKFELVSTEGILLHHFKFFAMGKGVRISWSSLIGEINLEKTWCFEDMNASISIYNTILYDIENELKSKISDSIFLDGKGSFAFRKTEISLDEKWDNYLHNLSSNDLVSDFIVNNFFRKDGIDFTKYWKNLRAIRRIDNSFNEKEDEIKAESFESLEYDLEKMNVSNTIKIGYLMHKKDNFFPAWFYSAYPDVSGWYIANSTYLASIFEEDDMKFYRKIIDIYKKNVGELECN